MRGIAMRVERGLLIAYSGVSKILYSVKRFSMYYALLGSIREILNTKHSAFVKKAFSAKIFHFTVFSVKA